MDKTKYSSPLSIRDVQVKDIFWSEMMEKTRTKVIPYQWEALNDRIEGADPSYCIHNFQVAAQLTKNRLDPENAETFSDMQFHGYVFQDSDLAKWIEAVGYSLAYHPDVDLEAKADYTIDLICQAQQDDGYLDTYYIINGLDKKFTNIKEHHELYCLGHMLEAAIAYYDATGKDKLLQAMIRFVDCVDSHIGVGEGKILAYPGHEVLEMALVRLYEITRNEKHLNLAKYFIDQRGQKPLFFLEEDTRMNRKSHWENGCLQYKYYQAEAPVREQTVAQGHAVRAVYLYSGMAAVAKESMDKSLYQACCTLFDNIANKQSYITGAIGQSDYGEAFTYDYDLPNDTVYAETCAQIGLIFFARRILEISPEGKYADLMERALFNGAISGMSLDGQSFFYVNPLEVVPVASEKDQLRNHVKVQRQKWFGCACCPPNLARLISSIGTYAHTMRCDTLYTHLYLSGKVNVTLNDKPVCVEITGNYPWDNKMEIAFTMQERNSFTYAVRIPGWCKEYTLLLNGKCINYQLENGYAIITREWSNADVLTLELAMPVTIVQSNPKVRENIGKVAVMRGPIVYCLEEEDNGADLHLISIGEKPDFQVKYCEELLGGVVILDSVGKCLSQKVWEGDSLYQEYTPYTYEEKKLRWIPYYTWANREPGEMIVWVRG